MKKQLFAAALAVICLSVAAYGTAAYFTAEDTAANTITAGTIQIDLQETALPEGGGDPAPFVDVTGVMPGTDVSKIVRVENTGGKAAYIRIRLDKAVTLAEGTVGEADTGLMTVDIDTVHWTEKNGYYYYNEALAPGEATSPLFTQVSFSREMGDLYQDSRAVITVRAGATQADNNGDSAVEAVGWPEV